MHINESASNGETHTITMAAEHNNFFLDVARYNTKGVPDRRDLILDCLTTLSDRPLAYRRIRTIVNQLYGRTFPAVRDLV